MSPSQHGAATERVARHVTRLADGTAGRKTQHFLESIAWAWGPERRSCFNRSKEHVDPTPDAVAAVASYIDARYPARVRVAALAALAHAGELAAEAAPALRSAMTDPERLVRLEATRVAVDAKLGDLLARELRTLLDDDVWAVRWYAARALAPRAYDAELGAFARMLVATTPRGGMALAGWAHAVDAVRPRCRVAGQAGELDAHVAATVASLSPRDRDFVWPLRS